jgi:hypothetical protein
LGALLAGVERAYQAIGGAREAIRGSRGRHTPKQANACGGSGQERRSYRPRRQRRAALEALEVSGLHASEGSLESRGVVIGGGVSADKVRDVAYALRYRIAQARQDSPKRLLRGFPRGRVGGSCRGHIRLGIGAFTLPHNPAKPMRVLGKLGMQGDCLLDNLLARGLQPRRDWLRATAGAG